MVASPDATLVGSMKQDWSRPTTSDWATVLSGLPLFARVGKRQLRKIAELARFEEFGAGDTIVQAGDEPDGFYVVLGGRAKVVNRPRSRPLAAGDYFGEMGLLDGEPRSATVTASGELQTMKLPRKPFLRLLKNEPTIGIAILGELAARVRRLEKPAAD